MRPWDSHNQVQDLQVHYYFLIIYTWEGYVPLGDHNGDHRPINSYPKLIQNNYKINTKGILLKCSLLVITLFYMVQGGMLQYIVSFIAPIVAIIKYIDTDAPSLGEIYETFDSMLGEMMRIICAKDPSSYEIHIKPIVQKRWDSMNNLLHMASYAINPKCYEPSVMPIQHPPQKFCIFEDPWNTEKTKA